MDIEYKDKDVEISIRNINKNNVGNEEFENVIKIINLLKDFKAPIKEVLKPIIEQKTQGKTKDKEEDRPVVRDRLPNQIDLSELEIKKAVTTEPMIRCPHCGQASKAIVHISATENYLLRKTNKNGKDTFETIAQLDSIEAIDNICKPENANILDYHSDIAKIKVPAKLKNTDLNVSNETILQCPVCRDKNKFSDWVNAFKNPLDFGFETDCLCDVCGHEAVAAIDKDKNKVIRCEDCGFEKPAL